MLHGGVQVMPPVPVLMPLVPPGLLALRLIPSCRPALRSTSRKRTLSMTCCGAATVMRLTTVHFRPSATAEEPVKVLAPTTFGTPATPGPVATGDPPGGTLPQFSPHAVASSTARCADNASLATPLNTIWPLSLPT